MERSAYKIPDAHDLIDRILAGRDRMNHLKQRAAAVAKTLDPHLGAEIEGINFNRTCTTTIIRPGWDATYPLVLPAGWRFILTRDAVEPRRGAPGAEARALLASIQPDFEQPGHVINETGLPAVFSIAGDLVQPIWLTHDGALYALADDRVPRSELGDRWISASFEELLAADRARLSAPDPTPAGR